MFVKRGVPTEAKVLKAEEFVEELKKASEETKKVEEEKPAPKEGN